MNPVQPVPEQSILIYCQKSNLPAVTAAVEAAAVYAGVSALLRRY